MKNLRKNPQFNKIFKLKILEIFKLSDAEHEPTW